MHNKAAQGLVFGLAGVIIILLAIFVFLPGSKPVTAGWQTYTGAGFSIQYPNEASVREGDPKGLYIEPDTDNATTLVSIVFPRVDTFSENGSHGYYEFQVRVDATKAMFACMVNPVWQNSTSSDAAAGNRITYSKSSICHGGRIYSVYDIFASGSDGTPLTPKLEADIAAGKIRNQQVVQSFQFTP